MSTFRAASADEDEKLSIILCNAFLPLWNHNWFQGISKPLEPIKYSREYSIETPLTSLQASRKQFYLSLIKLTRLHGGDINVSVAPHSESDSSEDYGAVLLWLPPGKQGGTTFDELPLLYRSGFLNLTLPWHYGPGAFHRIDGVYEANVHSMFKSALSPRGIDPKACGFVQMVAINSKQAGKGYASKLLQWRIEEHFKEFPDRPVILDTSTQQGVRAYERLGFELLGEKSVKTGTDALGIKLKKGADDGVKEEARKICVQRVMLKMPPQ